MDSGLYYRLLSKSLTQLINLLRESPDNVADVHCGMLFRTQYKRHSKLMGSSYLQRLLRFARRKINFSRNPQGQLFYIGSDGEKSKTKTYKEGDNYYTQCMCRPEASDQQEEPITGEGMDPKTIKLINTNNSTTLEKKSFNSETTAEEILDIVIGRVYEEVERNDLEDAIEDDRSIDTDLSDEDTEDDEPPEEGLQIVEDVIDKVLTSKQDIEEQIYDARIGTIHSQPNPSKTPTTNPPPPLIKPMAPPRSLRLNQNVPKSTPVQRSSGPKPSTSGTIKKRTPKRRLEFNPENPPYSDQNGSPQEIPRWLKPHGVNNYMPCQNNHRDLDVTFMTELEGAEFGSPDISIVDLGFVEEPESVDEGEDIAEGPIRHPMNY